MTETNDRDPMQREVASRERRRLRAREQGQRSAWFGLGLFGLVGWSVALPTLLGVGLGIWIDARAESQRSWTLMLMVGGLGVGCANAWYWVSRESNDESGGN